MLITELPSLRQGLISIFKAGARERGDAGAEAAYYSSKAFRDIQDQGIRRKMTTPTR
jgi:hypothetical protein